MIRIGMIVYCASLVLARVKIKTTYDDRIVGGNFSSGSQFPYQAALLSNGYQTCGAGIIGNYWLVTAAHCIYNVTDYSSYAVVVGTSNLAAPRSTYGTYRIAKFILNSNWTPVNSVDDIGLIKTAEQIAFNVNVKNIPLYRKYIAGNVPVTVSGFGRTAVNNSASPILKYLDTRTITNRECAGSFPGVPIRPGNLCAYKALDQGTCMGDSGSPLTYKNLLVGVVLRGVPCAVGKPDVYARISYYIPWILSNAK